MRPTSPSGDDLIGRDGLIDLHAHFVTEQYLQAAHEAGITQPDGMPAWPRWSSETQLAFMDQSGIETAVLSISSPGVHFGDDRRARSLAATANEEAANLCRAYPDRFRFFASLPLPDIDGALREVERIRNASGLAGFTVLSNVNGRYLGDQALDPVWAALDASAAIVLVHPTSPPSADRVDLSRPRPMLEFLFDAARAASDLVFGGATSRYRNVRWLFTHGGGVLPLLAERMALFAPLAAPGGAGVDVRGELSRFWYDVAGTPYPDQIPALVHAFGPERIVYGSDSCWTPDPVIHAQLAALDHAHSDQEMPWRQQATSAARRLLAGTAA